MTEDLFPFRRLSAGGVSPATARIQPGCFFFPPLPPLGLEASEAPQPLAAEGKEEEEEEEDGAAEGEGEEAALLGLAFVIAGGVDFSTRALAQAEAVTLPSSPSAAAAIAPSVAAAAAAL